MEYFDVYVLTIVVENPSAMDWLSLAMNLDMPCAENEPTDAVEERFGDGADIGNMDPGF